MSQRYLQLFLDEARDFLSRADAAMAGLRRGDSPGAAAELHRAWHSIKGMAAALDLKELVSLCHEAEGLLRRRGEEPEAAAGLHDGLDRALAQAQEQLAGLSRPPQIDEPAAALDAEASARSRPVPRARVSLPRTVKVPIDDLDALLSGLLDLEIDAARRDAAASGCSALRRLRRRMERLRRAPFALLVPALERVLADACRRLQRPAELQVEGARLLLERDALELLAEVLPHLLRNAVAHGIEDAESRRRSGKPPVGQIRLRVESRGRRLHLRLEDDGRGVDAAALCSALGPEAPGEEDLARPGLELSPWPCRPELSTSEQADLVSGRGFGLDAAQERILRAGGELSISSRPQGGLAIDLLLPATLAVTRCLVVRFGSVHAALPLASVLGLEPYRADSPPSMVESLLAAPGETRRPTLQVTVHGVRGEPLALGVDQALGKLEAVIRPLPAGSAGCAAMGTAVWNGQVPVLVLDTAALGRLAARVTARPGAAARAWLPESPGEPATDAGPAAG